MADHDRVHWRNPEDAEAAENQMVPAPSALVKAEITFHGSLAEFRAVIGAYDDRLKREASASDIGGAYIFRHVPTITEEVKAAALTGKVSPLALTTGKIQPVPGCETFAIWPPSLWPRQPDAGLRAIPRGDGSTLIELWFEASAWPEVNPLLDALRAELDRLGYLKSAKSRGGGPSADDIKHRAEWVYKWQKARTREKRLGADPFVAREKPGFSGSQLRRYAKDAEVLDYIKRNFPPLEQ